MSQPLVIVYLFILGLSIGSFLNVLIDRLPNDRKITGRSSCDYCRHKLSWFDLIPVFSFLFLAGACRYCKKKLSYFYPIVEITTGLFFVLSWLYMDPIQKGLYNDTAVKILYLGIISILIVIFFTDWKYQIIPDQIQIALFLLTLALFIAYGLSLQEISYRILEGFVVLLPILIIFLLTKGKGMGFGDVKLSFIIGFLLGVKSGLMVLYISFMLGAIIGIVLILSKQKKLKSKIAFGPFLVVGIQTLLFFKNELYNFTFRIFGY